MDYTHILGGADAVAQAPIGRAGAAFAVSRASGFSGYKRGFHDFTCVATAYGNALAAMGLPITANDCQRIADAGQGFTNGGRLSRATGRSVTDERLVDAVKAVGAKAGADIYIGRYMYTRDHPVSLGWAIKQMDEAGADFAVCATVTPRHAWALIPAGADKPLIVDNGGWDANKRLTWRGKNIYRMATIRRRDAPPPPKPEPTCYHDRPIAGNCVDCQLEWDAAHWRELDAAANAAIWTHSAMEWMRMSDRADAAKALAEQIGAA